MEHSKDSDRYYRDHATELNLFNAAEHVLHDKYNINPALMNYQHMQDSYKHMEEKKSTLTTLWKKAEKELNELETQLENFQKYMNQGGAESLLSHVHEENHEEEQKTQEETKDSQQKKRQSL